MSRIRAHSTLQVSNRTAVLAALVLAVTALVTVPNNFTGPDQGAEAMAEPVVQRAEQADNDTKPARRKISLLLFRHG